MTRQVVGWAVWASVLAAGAAAEPETRVRLGLLREVPVKWDLEHNMAVFERRLQDALKKDVDIFITPEGWLDGYAAPDDGSTRERLRGVAQPLEGSKHLDRVGALAKQHGLYICFGFTSLEDGKVFNAAGLWDRDGRLAGVYHKTHIQTHDVQYDRGEALPVWPTPWGPVGIMICADRRWPETARTLRLKGAKLILNPTYGFANDLNEAMMRTRAFENQCFIAFTHPQVSLITGPGGVIVGKAEDRPGVLVRTVDLRQAKDDNHLRDRRPELYGILTQR